MRLRAGPIALAIKLGPKLVATAGKLIKSAKATKLALAGASAVSYSWLFTWQFAAVIMLMLLVHESGHVWAMRRFGIPTKGFYFIPFVGGVAVPERLFRSRWEEVYVAMMGPVWGLGLAAAFLVAYWFTGHPLAAALASWMALINLLNLLPVNPLDGGRVLKSIVFSIGSIAGFAVMVMSLVVAFVLLVVAKIWILVILLAVGLFDVVMEWRRRGAGPPVMDGYGITFSALWFAATTALLLAIMWATAGNPEADLALELLRD